MPIPVPIPAGPRVVTDDNDTTAEQFVSAIAQIFRSGTTGSALTTPPTMYPDGEDPLTGLPILVPLTIDTAEKQLYYRQLALAIIQIVAAGTGQVLDDVSVNPGPSLIPRAGVDGKLLAGWLPNSVGTTFIAECPSFAVAGDLVHPVSGPSPTVQKASIYDIDALPAVGVIISKSDAITCTVQTSGLISGIFSGLLPGKRYFLGPSGRPTSTPPVPDVGGNVFLQPVGVALDPATFILTPSVQLTRLQG